VYPSAVLGDGRAALTPDAFEASKRKSGVPDDESYVKRIFEKHSGEARHWGGRGWRDVPSEFVDHLCRVRFWHRQCATSEKARDYLAWKNAGRDTGFLPLAEMKWILGVDGGEAELLKRVEDDSASGETRCIRTGQFVTLAEMFSYGRRLCSCHFPRTLHLRQPMLATRTGHSESQTAGATPKKNDRRLRYQETGRRGLPRRRSASLLSRLPVGRAFARERACLRAGKGGGEFDPLRVSRDKLRWRDERAFETFNKLLAPAGLEDFLDRHSDEFAWREKADNKGMLITWANWARQGERVPPWARPAMGE
ncbi:unnamed protein product, partial [Prorocentrum cordatum]